MAEVFDRVSIDLDRSELLDGAGRPIALRRRSLGFLMRLAKDIDRVVTKQELIEANWRGPAVTDESLARCASDIRAVLGPELRRTLRTVSGRGYMLCGWTSEGGGNRLVAPSAAAGTANAPRPSIAVLPFASLGDDREQTYLADGIVENLITALSRVRWLFVIARSSSFTYRGQSPDARRIGRELGVRYVLQGTIRKAGARIRLTGQLVEAGTARQLWAGRYDCELTDIFELEDRVTESVLAAIEPNLKMAEIERARSKPTESLDSYDLYLRALPVLYTYTEADFREAEALLRKAVVWDHTFSDALAALADCVGRMALNGWVRNREEAFAEACLLAGRAVAADPENASSLATAAWSRAMFSGGFDEALELAERALSLHPNSHAIRSYCGWVFAYAGECDRAIEQFEEARKMSPVDPRGYFPLLGIATSHFFAKRFEKTIGTAQRILREVPTHNIARRYLVAALAHAGRTDEATEAAAALLREQPGYTVASARGSRFRHPWMLDLYADGLQKAGIPLS